MVSPCLESWPQRTYLDLIPFSGTTSKTSREKMGASVRMWMELFWECFSDLSLNRWMTGGWCQVPWALLLLVIVNRTADGKSACGLPWRFKGVITFQLVLLYSPILFFFAILSVCVGVCPLIPSEVRFLLHIFFMKNMQKTGNSFWCLRFCKYLL